MTGAPAPGVHDAPAAPSAGSERDTSAAPEARRLTPAVLADLLWGPGTDVWAGSGDPPKGFEVVETFALLPSGRPRLFVPLGHPPAARASLRQFNQGMSQAARLRKALVGAALGTPGLRGGARRRISVARRTGSSCADGGSTLGERLGDALGVDGLTYCVTLGHPRSNAKPVLQLLTPDGRVVGYAKVAWNGLTARLVTHEAEVLRAWERRPPSTFRVPRVVATLRWRGRDVTVTSPIRHPVRRRGALNADVPASAVREIVEREAAASVAALADHPGWRALRVRAESIAGPRAGDVSHHLDAVEARHGAAAMPFGSWHGDLAPGNTSIVDGRLHIWDWERCANSVPAGLDPIHWAFQLRLFAGAPVQTAAIAALQSAAPALDRLDIDGRARRGVLAWYLLERFARFEEAREGGTLGDRDEQIIDGLLSAVGDAAR